MESDRSDFMSDPSLTLILTHTISMWLVSPVLGALKFQFSVCKEHHTRVQDKTKGVTRLGSLAAAKARSIAKICQCALNHSGQLHTAFLGIGKCM